MPARALIIAIEDYPGAVGLAAQLPGTNEAGDTFRRWFIDTKYRGQDPGAACLRYCGAAGREGVTAGTTRDAILDEMDRFVLGGKDRTEELFVFFSGHGVAFEERPGKPRLDVLLCSDITELRKGGRASIIVDDLQEKAQYALGRGEHFYFVDACRNLVGPGDIKPSEIDIVWPPSRAGMACVLTLQSTRTGARAHVRGGFQDALLAGLRGAGRAKQRTEARKMAVTFDRLARYVRLSVPDQESTPSNPQACDGVIQVLDPAPKSRCSVRVDNIPHGTRLELVISDPNGDFDDKVSPFVSPSGEVELSPNEYGLRVVEPGSTRRFRRVIPLGDEPVDLWDSREVVFEPAPAVTRSFDPVDFSPPQDHSSPLARLRLSAPEGTRVSLTRHNGDTVYSDITGSTPLERALGVGEYVVHARRGAHVSRGLITLAEGEDRSLDLLPEHRSAVRDQILVATGNDPRGRKFEVSESLGPFTEGKLGLLLSLLGAGRIVEPHDRFEKMRDLPLATFDDMRPGESAVYALAAFDPAGPPPHVTLAGITSPMRPVKGFDGLFELRARVGAGPYLLTFSRAGSGLTLATHVLPNRATLITLSEPEPGDEGELEIHQYLLPLHTCQQNLRPEELEHLQQSGPLRFVRLLWRVQDLFAAKRELTLQGDDDLAWLYFLWGKWLDPIMAILAAYELLRRGRSDGLEVAVDNLSRYFGEIPDAQLLLRLLGKPWARPTAPTLVRQGLRAWPAEDGAPPMPLPLEDLLYRGMWTAWRHVQVGPEPLGPAGGNDSERSRGPSDEPHA